MMYAVRYGIPILFVIGGFVMLILAPGSTGLEGFFMAIGAALAVLYLNFLFRQGAREREEEEAAREHLGRTGHWPGE